MKTKPFFFCNHRFLTSNFGFMVQGYRQQANPWNDAQDVKGIQIHLGTFLFEIMIHVGIECSPTECKFTESNWPP